MHILPLVEGFQKMGILTQVSHYPELNLRIVGGKNHPVGRARHKGLADFLSPFSPDWNVLEVRFGGAQPAGGGQGLIECSVDFPRPR